MHYLKVSSQKTNTLTRIELPQYAMDILKKYAWNRKSIFPEISNGRFNSNIKALIEKTNWTDIRTKTRNKRGIPVQVYKNPKTKEHYRFCDLVTTHTMRRTAITTLLAMGMTETAVRKISGHAANSKEFYKYVELSQKFMNSETRKAFEKLNNLELIKEDISLFKFDTKKQDKLPG